ncbi:MAG: hypothetical protein WCJ84_06570 [Candidatus Peregrinibacteria bacterium]
MGSPTERIAFFDESNFYYKLKDLEIKNITHFDYAGLLRWIARDRVIVSQTYLRYRSGASLPT